MPEILIREWGSHLLEDGFTSCGGCLKNGIVEVQRTKGVGCLIISN